MNRGIVGKFWRYWKEEPMQRGLLALILCGFGFIGDAVAAPVCTAQPLSVYITPGFECSFGEFTLMNAKFKAINLGSESVTLATAADIMVTPADGLGGWFQFESDMFSVTGNQHVGYEFSYFIDPPPPIIPGFGDEMFSQTPISPGYARLTTDVCIDGSFVSGDTVCPAENRFQVEVFHNGLPDGTFDLFDEVRFPHLTNKIDVRNFLELNANGASSQINGFGNRIGVTPEPGALALAGAGLAALLLLRRR